MAPRFARDSRAQLFLHPGGRHPHPIDVSVVNYSATGIGIVHSEGLLVGQTFIVREPFVTQNSTCLYTVVRSDRLADGSYSIGLHVGNTMADELERYSSPPPPPLSRRAKQWYFVYAIGGTLLVVALTALKHSTAPRISPAGAQAAPRATTMPVIGGTTAPATSPHSATYPASASATRPAATPSPATSSDSQ